VVDIVAGCGIGVFGPGIAIPQYDINT